MLEIWEGMAPLASPGYAYGDGQFWISWCPDISKLFLLIFSMRAKSESFMSGCSQNPTDGLFISLIGGSGLPVKLLSRCRGLVIGSSATDSPSSPSFTITDVCLKVKNYFIFSL